MVAGGPARVFLKFKLLMHVGGFVGLILILHSLPLSELPVCVAAVCVLTEVEEVQQSVWHD